MIADKRARAALVGGLLLVVLVELLRTAWLSDDSAITLRTVLNFLHGWGPNFNIDERVQAYTHPLWFLLVSALSWLGGNVFLATMGLGILVSLASVWLLVTRVAKDEMTGVVGALALVLSKAWVDFATSGLENPLAQLVLLLAFVAGTGAVASRSRRDLTFFFVLCSLLYLTRPDLLLLVAPFALWVMFRAGATPAELGRAMAVGALPALLWTAFSLFYYGFPFTNTAYAKLGTGIPLAERLPQGGRYFLDSLQRDPLTLAVIVAGVVAGAWMAGAARALAIGVVLYLAWVASIGGDFMSGRFFTVPLVAAVAMLVRAPLPRARLPLAVVAIVALGIPALPATLLSGRDYENVGISTAGIADERGFYFQDSGLFSLYGRGHAEPGWVAGERDFAVVCGGLGFFSISGGPALHVIDSCGLADPLLSRLPAQFQPNWRIGHFLRQLPTDYVQSVYHGDNRLADPATRAYYESIRHVTRGPLAAAGRLREILRLNLGQVPLPDARLYRDGHVPRSSRQPVITLDALRAAKDPVGFVETLDVVLPSRTSITSLRITVGANDRYEVSCLVDGQFMRIDVAQEKSPVEGMASIAVKPPAPTPPTDRIRLSGSNGDGRYALADMRINEAR